MKLTLVAAALCGGLLALAPTSGAMAAPMGSIGKAAAAIDFPGPACLLLRISPSPALLVAPRPAHLPLVIM